jgi:hypothetical protein
VTPFASRLCTFSLVPLALLALSGCTKKGDIDESGGVVTIRSSCPVAAIPVMTGDITLFSPENSRDASAIDVVANIANLRSTCSQAGDQYYSEATFDVQARRTRTDSPREVVLPYFSVVVRGGDAVISKRIGEVRLSFAAGQERATATARAASYVDKAAADLPTDIDRKIHERRKTGDTDAALDPLADPKVKAALRQTSFELLVGFNLTQDQLRYNATR